MKKTLISIALSILLLGSASAVYAYWTARGSGTATASAAASTSMVTVNQRSVITGVDPGAAPQTISGTFTNVGSGPAYVSTVTVTVSVTKAAGAPAGSCTAADYTITGGVMPVAAEIPVGSNVGSWGGATIAFNDSPANVQDACKGATITLTYAVS